VAKDATQSAIARDVQRSTHSQTASASITSFPFLYDVTADGRIDRLVITDRGVPAGPVTIESVRLVASQVRFDRHELLVDQKVHLVSVGRATVTAVVQLSGLEGVIASGLDLRVTASGSDHVVVSVAGHQLAVLDLTRIPIVPPCSLQITHSGTRYTFACSVSPVPPTILAALNNKVTLH
jgi:hypothetical protein